MYIILGLIVLIALYAIFIYNGLVRARQMAEEAWSGIGVCLIEWAEQAGNWLPSEHIAIHLQHLSETKRVLRFVPYGARYQELLAEFKKTAVA